MGKNKYTYSTKVTKKGTFRIRHWIEYFTDGDTGEKFPVKRAEPIKFNGEKIRFYSTQEIKRMTPEQRKKILI